MYIYIWLFYTLLPSVQATHNRCIRTNSSKVWYIIRLKESGNLRSRVLDADLLVQDPLALRDQARRDTGEDTPLVDSGALHVGLVPPKWSHHTLGAEGWDVQQPLAPITRRELVRGEDANHLENSILPNETKEKVKNRKRDLEALGARAIDRIV